MADGAAAAAQPWVAIVESHMDTESVTSEGERRAPSKAYWVHTLLYESVNRLSASSAHDKVFARLPWDPVLHV